jgi:hypothetical protein
MGRRLGRPIVVLAVAASTVGGWPGTAVVRAIAGYRGEPG